MVKKKKSITATSSARLASVQSLYEIEISGSSSEAIMLDFLQQRWAKFHEEFEDFQQPNKSKFGSLIRGVRMEKNKLDEIIAAAIDKDRRFERLDVLLKTILRAGTFELLRETNVPLAVVIDEYVEITHAFYSENIPAFVNGVLNNIGKTLRPS